MEKRERQSSERERRTREKERKRRARVKWRRGTKTEKVDLCSSSLRTPAAIKGRNFFSFGVFFCFVFCCNESIDRGRAERGESKIVVF